MMKKFKITIEATHSYEQYRNETYEITAETDKKAMAEARRLIKQGLTSGWKTRICEINQILPSVKSMGPRNGAIGEYPLLTKGYDALECPNCDKVCYPDAEAANGTIIYSRHKCKNKYQLIGEHKRFEIDTNGNIVE